ncbi:hypothetical protein FPQ18DRAFT_309317 [Pyronema domesticum]|nr:hypothetical protein FPQ18DRAFT_309317 [Pyronema domesticum]
MLIFVAISLTAGIPCAAGHCEQVSKLPSLPDASATISAPGAPTITLNGVSSAWKFVEVPSVSEVSSTLSKASPEKKPHTASFGISTGTTIEKTPTISEVRSAEQGPHCYWTPCGSYNRCGVGYRNMKEQLCSKFQTNLRCYWGVALVLFCVYSKSKIKTELIKDLAFLLRFMLSNAIVKSLEV